MPETNFTLKTRGLTIQVDSKGFFAADKFCRTSHGKNNKVFDDLKHLVANARCVVVTDAHIDARTIEFLETCRPNEIFRIINIPEPKHAGIDGIYYLGNDAVGHIAQQGITELDSGGKVWIAAEAKKSVNELHTIFDGRGYRTLAIHADNKGDGPQRRLLENAEAESRHYDVVIASPVISSGISIQHESVLEEQRFTLGLYVGGGYAHTPADALQQLRRVRYLNRFVLGLRRLGKREGGALNYDDQIAAAEMATDLENKNQQITSFDHFIADIRVEEEHAKRDFAAGLLWQLEAAGWNLVPSSHGPSESFSNAQASAAALLHKQYVDALISAPVLDDIQAGELRRIRNRTEAQNLILEAHTVRTYFGVDNDPLTPELVKFWDHGRGAKKLELFDASRGIVPKHTHQEGSAIHSEYPLAKAKALKWLFEGIDILKPYRDDTATIVANRAFEESKLLNFLGITPVLKKRTGQPTRLMNKVLRTMGLTVKEVDKSRVECSQGKAAIKSGKGNPAKRFYAVTPDSYHKLQLLADQRNCKRETISLCVLQAPIYRNQAC